MKKYKEFFLVGLLVTSMLGAFVGCGEKPTATTPVTPKEEFTALPPSAIESTRQLQETEPTLKTMLAWLDSLPKEQRATLEKTNKLKISFSELKTSDPEHAKFIEQYIAKAQPKDPVPITVRFSRMGGGEYEIGADTSTAYIFEQIYLLPPPK